MLDHSSPQAVDWPDLIRRFDHRQAQALVLVGSFARGTANAFSDVDLLRLTTRAAPSLPGRGSHLVHGRLVTVKDAAPAEVETWFVRPELAVTNVPGLREGRALQDRGGVFAPLQARARAFVWDDAMQQRADAFASEELVGWIEEVHKGLVVLVGPRRGETGRLLDAEFGLSWGLNRLISVQRGVPLVPLASGERWSDDWFVQVEQAVGLGSQWARWRRQAFGLPPDLPLPVPQRVRAGLWLYVATAELLAGVLTPAAEPMVAETVRLIHEALPEMAEAVAPAPQP